MKTRTIASLPTQEGPHLDVEADYESGLVLFHCGTLDREGVAKLVHSLTEFLNTTRKA